MRKMRMLWKYPYITFFIVALACLYRGIVDYHNSILIKSYIETEGIVCNLEKEQVKQKNHEVTRYNYDIVWYDDGEKYIKHFVQQAGIVEEGKRTIWVQPDNRDVVLSNSATLEKDVRQSLIFGIVCGLIGLVIYEIKRRTRNESQVERDERLEDAKWNGMWTMIFAGIVEVAGVVAYYQYYKQYISPVIWDLFIAAGVVGVIGLVVYLRALKQLKDG